ncbi:MAG: hypothetical protein ACHQNE_04165 [Candidatus Kapaibacterium sp.]
MPDFAKLDRMDIEVIDEPWTPEERKALSEYLKAQKAKQTRHSNARSLPSARMKPKAKVKR